MGESSTAIATAARPLFSYPPASSSGAPPAPASLTIAIFASSSLSPQVDPGSPEGSPPTEKILLCKRGIEPRIGKWGLPQGFMELGETSREGAAREAFEESGASITPGVLLSVYNLPGQVQLLYVATIAGGTVDDATGEHVRPR